MEYKVIRARNTRQTDALVNTEEGRHMQQAGVVIHGTLPADAVADLRVPGESRPVT